MVRRRGRRVFSRERVFRSVRRWRRTVGGKTGRGWSSLSCVVHVSCDSPTRAKEANPATLRFLPPSAADDTSEELTAEVGAPSPSYSTQEFDDDDAGEEQETEEQSTIKDSDRDDLGREEDTADQRGTTSSTDSEIEREEPEHLADQTTARSSRYIDDTVTKPIKPATRAVSKGSVFFRDEETLREMKRSLEQEKRDLTHDRASLATQLADKEQVAAELKRELQQLKAKLSLSSALHASSSASTSARQPKTAAEWKQRAMDQKLENEQLQHDILVLKTAVQEQQARVRDKYQRCEQLKARVARVPRRDLLTLVELRVEIAQLLQRKRELEAGARATQKLDQSKVRFNNSDKQSHRDSGGNRTTPEKELAKLELSITQAQEDARRWRTKFECEQARLQPMRERLVGLHRELEKYHDANVLLRSLFMRLDTDGDTFVDRNIALEAFAMLAPPEHEFAGLTAAELEARLGVKQQHSVSNSKSTDQLTFAQFVDAFDALFKS